MAAEIYVAQSSNDYPPRNPPDRSVWMEDDGYYWHLYRFFEGANLDRRRELIDLYGDAEFSGYQLDRLEDELQVALKDAHQKPAKWSVLTGWSDHPSRENEIWREVDREKMLDLITQLLWLVSFAKDSSLQIICTGD